MVNMNYNFRNAVIETLNVTFYKFEDFKCYIDDISVSITFVTKGDIEYAFCDILYQQQHLERFDFGYYNSANGKYDINSQIESILTEHISFVKQYSETLLKYPSFDIIYNNVFDRFINKHSELFLKITRDFYISQGKICGFYILEVFNNCCNSEIYFYYCSDKRISVLQNKLMAIINKLVFDLNESNRLRLEEEQKSLNFLEDTNFVNDLLESSKKKVNFTFTPTNKGEYVINNLVLNKVQIAKLIDLI